MEVSLPVAAIYVALLSVISVNPVAKVQANCIANYYLLGFANGFYCAKIRWPISVDTVHVYRQKE